MKNSIILLSFLFISTLFAQATNNCDFYNSQYDKYVELASDTPDESAEKVHFIRKMDFYDAKIYQDDSCNFKETRESDNILKAF